MERHIVEQVLITDVKIPIILWGMNNNGKFREIIGLNNLVFVNIASVNDPITEVVAKSLEGLHFMAMLFIYHRSDNQPPTRLEIRQFFEWCWQENIINAVLTYQTISREWNGSTTLIEITNEFFNYTPFPQLTIFNLTDRVNNGRSGFIVDIIRNVHGYRFVTPICTDPPYVFLTPFDKLFNRYNNLFVTGTYGFIYNEYIQFVNGSIDLKTIENVTYYRYQKEAIRYASQKIIDIGIHPYSGLLPHANETEGSYPTDITNACIIVPVVAEIDQSEYLLRAFQPTIYLVVFLEFLSLIMVQFLHLGKYDMGRVFLDAFRTILCQPVAKCESKNRGDFLKIIHLLVIFVSAMLNACYSGSLTSMLSTTIIGQQITTVDEFLESGLQIMIDQHEKEVFFDTDLFPRRLKSKIYLVNESYFWQHKVTLNTSYAYVVTLEEWLIFEFQQRLLWIPKFRIASSNDLCTAFYFTRLPVQWDSPFASSLKFFLNIAFQSGLRGVWDYYSFAQAIKLGYFNVLIDDNEDPVIFGMNHFRKALQFYCVLIFLSGMCFLLEIIWHYRINIIRNIKLK